MSLLQDLIDILSYRYATVKELLPDHNPIAHHVMSTAREGDSYFREDIQSVEDVLKLLEKYVEGGIEWYHIPTPRVTICTMAVFPENVGTEVTSPPLPGEQYKIIRDHAGLIPSGKTSVKRRETNRITFVVTLEKNEVTGKEQYAMASVYPGEADNTGNWIGLKEGDIVSGEELIRRKFTRVKDIKDSK